MLHVPPFLKPGDRIRIVAPSGAFDRAAFDAGIALIESAGFVPVYEDGLFARHRYLAGTDRHRLASLRQALDDSDASGVWAARGGYGAGRIVGALGETAVRERPQWLVGFSDTTALHARFANAQVVSIHGANVTTLASWSEEARRELFAMLTGEQRVIELTGSAAAGGVGPVVGPLRGGNLTVLASLAGTPELPTFDGAIVVLEDVGEVPYRLDRVVNQLLRAGAFSGAVGFAIGQLTRCGREDDPTLALEVVLESLKPLDVPIVSGLPVGHEVSSRAVWLGANATLDPGSRTLRVSV